MSKVHATIGKGKKVHAIIDGEPVCGAKVTTLHTTDEARDCKNCDRLIYTVEVVDTVTDEEETENMEQHESDRLNGTTDAGRFIAAMDGYDVDCVENNGATIVTVRREYMDGSKVLVRVVWDADGFRTGSQVGWDGKGHVKTDLSESDVASMTYHFDPTPMVALDAAA